jgi:hypothetical protein
MDNWEELIIGPVQTLLGLVINSYKLTVGIPDTYVCKVLLLLNNTWPGRKQFMVLEAQKLTGKLGHLAQGATWTFHLLSHLYALIAYALSKNKSLLLESSKEFQNIILLLKMGTYLGTPNNKAKHISFVMRQAAKLVHHAKYRYNITKTMHQEIEFFSKKLQPSSSILWETPIAHIIPRMFLATAFGDSCLEGAGGYSISLGFWWHLPFPKKVIQ